MPPSPSGALFQKLVDVVARLRAPNGCPWDREQTPRSAVPYLLEEAHEAAEAIDTGDPAAVKEELGDLLLQVVFQTQLIADTSRAFQIDDVIAIVTEKLIRRHPHVFGNTAVHNTDEVLANWEKIKREEKPPTTSMLEGIPKALPALLRAYRLGQKASRVGFDWPNAEGILSKVDEEVRELHAARSIHLRQGFGGQAQNAARIDAEFGDLLFTLANLARFLDCDPEGSLRRAAQRFEARFRRMETEAVRRRRALNSLSAAEWDALWEAAKREEDRRESAREEMP